MSAHRSARRSPRERRWRRGRRGLSARGAGRGQAVVGVLGRAWRVHVRRARGRPRERRPVRRRAARNSAAVSPSVRAGRARYGLQWPVLAGIGKVECDHGRDSSPSCTSKGRSTPPVPAGRCSSSRRHGRSTAWMPTATAGLTAGIPPTRSTPPRDICERRAPRAITPGDLRLQPRSMVRRRGRKLGRV